MERAMHLQEVIFKAIGGELHWSRAEVTKQQESTRTEPQQTAQGRLS
jgi:hypothetical protein